MSNCTPVLLSGGLGARLWPLSRAVYPKQLLTMLGTSSLLQQNARRALKLAPAEQIITVTIKSQYRQVRDQLYELEPDLVNNLLVEPEPRNTAAAISLAALHSEKNCANCTLLVMPSDHAISSDEALLRTMKEALTLAENGRIVTLGVVPTRPETAFGYITVGGRVFFPGKAFNANSFIEKPDLATAKKLVARDDVYWNSGIFIFTAKTLLGEMSRFANISLIELQKAYENGTKEDGVLTFANSDYQKIPSIPIDKIVMERSEKLVLVPLNVNWSDVGSWERVWEASQKNQDGVTAIGDVMAENCRNSFLQSEDRLLVGVGVEDIAVIETADAVLVAKMGSDEELKSALTKLKEQERPEATRHLKENRPWGFFRILMEKPGFKIKELSIDPGGRLSLQSHKNRSEHWVVVEGTATVTKGDEVTSLETNQSTYIPAKSIHRLENHTTSVVKVIEVQCGECLSEDDIERYQDAYGRKTEATF